MEGAEKGGRKLKIRKIILLQNFENYTPRNFRKDMHISFKKRTYTNNRLGY